MKKVIFLDFDGTITKVDTCSLMVEAFAKEGWEALNKLWEDKKLSTAACANQTFKLFEANIEDVKKLMETIEIDEYFKEFLSLCRSKGYDTYVLSDGYDFNIQAVLQRHDIDITYFANRMLYDSSKGFDIECPHENSLCKNCGTCKTNLIKELNKDGNQVVYIGDSYSDMCPAAIADVVFAKGVLYDYCLEKGINAVHFDDFRDIILSGLL